MSNLKNCLMPFMLCAIGLLGCKQGILQPEAAEYGMTELEPAAIVEYIVIKCPSSSCNERQQRRILLSGNAFDAQYYTDGKRKAPFLPEFPNFIKCHSCGAFFKITDQIGEGPSSATPFPAIPPVSFMSIDEYGQAINKGLNNSGAAEGREWKEDVLRMRIELWKAFNDRVRYRDNFVQNANDAGVGNRAVYADNCRKILSELENINIFAEDNDLKLLITGEIYRNLGEFNKCRELLKKIQNQVGYEDFISAIGMACDINYTFTFCLGIEIPTPVRPATAQPTAGQAASALCQRPSGKLITHLPNYKPVWPNVAGLASGRLHQAEVKVRFVVGPDGLARNIRTTGGPAELHKAAADYVRDFRFRTQKDNNGRPCSYAHDVTVIFTADKRTQSTQSALAVTNQTASSLCQKPSGKLITNQPNYKPAWPNVEKLSSGHLHKAEVKVRFVVGPDGLPRDIKAAEGPSELHKSAVDYISDFRFKIQRDKNGKPCAYTHDVTVTFIADKRTGKK